MNKQKFDAVFLDIAMPDFSGLKINVIDSLLENGKIKDRQLDCTFHCFINYR